MGTPSQSTDNSNSSFPFTVHRQPSNRASLFVLKRLSSYIQHTDFRVRVCVCVRTFTNCQKYRNRPSTALIENKAKIQVCGVCACVCETWRKRVCACQYTVDFSTFQESTLYCCSDLFLVSCSLLIRYRDGLAVVVKSVHFESVLSSCVKRSFSSRARLYRNGPWHSLNSWAVEVPKSIHHWRLPDSDIDLRKTDFSGGANLVRG